MIYSEPPFPRLKTTERPNGNILVSNKSARILSCFRFKYWQLKQLCAQRYNTSKGNRRYSVVAVVVTVKVYTMHWKFSKNDNDIYYFNNNNKKEHRHLWIVYDDIDIAPTTNHEDRYETKKRENEIRTDTRHTTRNIPNLVQVKLYCCYFWLRSNVISIWNRASARAVCAVEVSW